MIKTRWNGSGNIRGRQQSVYIILYFSILYLAIEGHVYAEPPVDPCSFFFFVPSLRIHEHFCWKTATGDLSRAQKNLKQWKKNVDTFLYIFYIDNIFFSVMSYWSSDTALPETCLFFFASVVPPKLPAGQKGWVEFTGSSEGIKTSGRAPCTAVPVL